MKAIKHIVWMVALAMTATTLGACSNDDDASEQKDKVRIVTVTLPDKSISTTRGLSTTDPEDGTLTDGWETGDKIMVSYQQEGDVYESLQASVVVTAGVAKITIPTTNAEDGGWFSFGYPYNFYLDEASGGKEGQLYGTPQLGTLEDIRDNYDIFYGDGIMTVNGSDVTFNLDTSIDPNGMYRETCIWKFKFTESGTDVTDNVTSLSINGGYPQVNPTELSVIYVAMGATTSEVDFEATIAGANYKWTKNVSTTEGKLYTVTLDTEDATVVE